ncbi:MAG: CBS domain-containing protein [Anaerolineae bacterium]
MLQKSVKDIMHHGVISCKYDTSVADVVRILSDTDIHALVITGDAGEAVGIVSHMDVIKQHGADLTGVTAAQIMSKDVLSVSPHARVQEAVDVMIARRIHRLVVTEQQGDILMPVGVLSTTDIVREMRGSKWTWYV